MYPLGLLFGLGFDTATEVALLVLAGTGAASGLPWYAILTLPVLFAAGMSLLDTIDGSFMNFAYGWAFSKPVRKVYYNITITGSVRRRGPDHRHHRAPRPARRPARHDAARSGTGSADFDLNNVGFVIVGLFVLTWVVALLVWRFGRIEEKWSAQLEG